MDPAIIYSERLRLIPMTPSFLSASLSGSRTTASEAIGLTLADDWFTEHSLMDLRLAQLRQDPSLQPWLLRAIAPRHEPIMMGHIGFHSQSAPDYLRDYAPKGVEFGYTIYPLYQRQGYATEACAALMEWATAVHHVTQFVLTIAPDNIPSQRIAHRFGFIKVGELVDETDGLEEIFLLQVADFPRKI